MLMLLSSMCLTMIARAADQTWKNDGVSNNWSTAAGSENWDAGVVWGTGNNAIFGTAGETVSITAPITAGNLTFNVSNYLIDSSAPANTLTLASGSIINTGANNNATINSALAGGPIVKSGLGTLILNAANNFGGTLTVSQGRLQISNAGALNAAANLVIGNANSSGTPNIYFNGGGTPAFATLTVASGVVGARIESDAWAPAVTGVTTLNSPLTIHRAGGGGWGGLYHGGKITGTGAGSGNDSLILDAAGGGGNFAWQSQSNTANDFAGNVKVTGGVIYAQGGANGPNDTVIPNSAMVTIVTGSQFRWNNFGGSAVNETIDGLAGGGIMTNGVSTTLTINANNGSNEGNRNFSGNLAINNALTLGGTGTQEFSGSAPSFTNPINLNNGTLKLTNTTAWASAIALGTTNAPAVQLNAPLATDSWSFGKTISGANTAANVQKAGLGAVNLTAAHSYTGTTAVTAGKLILASTTLATTMPSISGMKVWLDAGDPAGTGIAPANGAAITTWVNKAGGSVGNFTLFGSSGNSPTYTTSNASFNNKPVVSFSAAGKQLSNATDFGNTTTVVYVGRIGGTKKRLVGCPNQTTNWLLGYWNANMNANYWGGAGGYLGSAADTNPHIWLGGATGGAYNSYRFDGGGEAWFGTGTGATGPNGLSLGGGYLNENSDGDIAEVLVFDHQLTPTERQQLEGYLYNKYYGTPYGYVSLNPASPVSVAANSTFGGYGSAGNVTVASGGTVEGGYNGAGALTAGSLTFNGTGTLRATLATGVTPVVVTGALATSGGANSISVDIPNFPVNGIYHLLQFGSYSGSINNFKFAENTRSMTFQLNGNFLDVVVASSPVLWTGVGSGEWSHNLGLGNWKLLADNSSTDFMLNDNALFNDSSTRIGITVGQTNINAAVIAFDNTTKDYTLTQANGKDITDGSLIKTGSGKLTVAGSFTFPGGSSLGGGVVSINSVTSLGTGGRSFGGGTLEYTGATGTLGGGTTLNTGGGTINVVTAGTVLAHTGAFSGTSAFTKTGSGTLALALPSGTYGMPLQISAGTLNLNYGGNGVTVSGPITGSAGILRLDGTGASATSGITFTGNNTFSGDTQIYGYRVFLDSPAGNAINGNIVIKQGSWPVHGLMINRDEQIANTAVLQFEALNNYYGFTLNGKTETLAGIVSADFRGVIENASIDGGYDTGIAAGKLIVSGSSIYEFKGFMRNQSGGNNGVLAFEKSGAGTQTLTGPYVTYTGATTINNGTLELKDVTGFASPVTINGGTLELYRTSGSWNFGSVIGSAPGAGNVKITGPSYSTVNLTGANTYTGTTTIASGKLAVTGSIASSPLIDVQTAGILSGTTVASGQTVQGTGELSNVTFGSGSTLKPGNTTTQIATIDGYGSITFQAGSTCVMQVNSNFVICDQLDGMDAIAFGGTLTVTDTAVAPGATSPFISGDELSLFPWAGSYSGSFSSFNLPKLNAGLYWDLSQLTTDGSIKVINTPPLPVFNPPAGGYVGVQSVSISSEVGSTIYYTMDGSPPSLASSHGLSPVTGLTVPANSTVTIKAFAVKSGQPDTPVATALYRTYDTATWISPFDGEWVDTDNWQDSVVAQGSGVTADFSTLTLSGNTDVYLDGTRTVGCLILGDLDADLGAQYGWNISQGSGGSLILNNGASPPVVTVNNQSSTISAPTISTNGLLKDGNGKLILSTENSITGPLNIAAGALQLNTINAIPDGSALTLGSNGVANPTLTLGFSGSKSFGALTVPAGSTGAAISTLNASTNLSIAGASLGSSLTIAQSNATNQVTWTSKLTGNGAGSGNDTLVFNNTSPNQNGFTMAAGQINDFLGNVRVKGFVVTQSGSPGSNQLIPDASMLVIQSGQWRWDTSGSVETIDGLAGAGAMNNANNVTLTINSSNADNAGDRNFSGSLGTMADVFTKSGTGTQTFSGTGINYTNATTINGGTLELSGTTAYASSSITVNGGTLLVNNTTGTGTGTTAAITVKSGATIAGAGSVGGTTTIEADGIVAPGNGGIGTLTGNDVVFSGNCQIQVGASTSDLLAVTGTLTTTAAMSPPTITITTTNTPTATSYTIATYVALNGPLPSVTGVPGGYAVDTSTTGQIKLVKTASGFNSWADGFVGLTDKTPGGDPDNDGIENLMEYVIGGDPRASSTQFLPTHAIVGTNLVISYKRSDASESDTTQIGQWSVTLNLGSWTNVTPVLVNENDVLPDDMTVTIPMSNAPSGKLFGRIIVTQP